MIIPAETWPAVKNHVVDEKHEKRKFNGEFML